MKKAFSILFLILYSIAMLKPVMPFIDYYMNYNYIATTLCENKDKPMMHCNGKCYLEKLIKKENNQEKNTNSKAPSIDFSKYPVSLIEIENKTPLIDEKLLTAVIYNNNLIPQEIYSKDFRPPKLV